MLVCGDEDLVFFFTDDDARTCADRFTHTAPVIAAPVIESVAVTVTAEEIIEEEIEHIPGTAEIIDDLLYGCIGDGNHGRHGIFDHFRYRQILITDFFR